MPRRFDPRRRPGKPSLRRKAKRRALVLAQRLRQQRRESREDIKRKQLVKRRNACPVCDRLWALQRYAPAVGGVCPDCAR